MRNVCISHSGSSDNPNVVVSERSWCRREPLVYSIQQWGCQCKSALFGQDNGSVFPSSLLEAEQICDRDAWFIASVLSAVNQIASVFSLV